VLGFIHGPKGIHRQSLLFFFGVFWGGSDAANAAFTIGAFGAFTVEQARKQAEWLSSEPRRRAAIQQREKQEAARRPVAENCADEIPNGGGVASERASSDQAPATVAIDQGRVSRHNQADDLQGPGARPEACRREAHGGRHAQGKRPASSGESLAVERW